MKEKELPRKGGLSSCARASLEKYFHDLDGEKPASDLYDLVIREIERPLLEIVMKYVKSNQCRAAELLGINRNTLRKKLKLHKLDK